MKNKMLVSLISLTMLFSTSIAKDKVDCDKVVEFYNYCQGACIYGDRAKKKALFEVENIDDKRCKITIGDTGSLKITQKGFVAKNFKVERIFCKGISCYNTIGKKYNIYMYVRQYGVSGKKKFKFYNVEYKGEPIELDIKPVKNIKFLYYDLAPVKGAKGISTSMRLEFIIRSKLTFELEPMEK